MDEQAEEEAALGEEVTPVVRKADRPPRPKQCRPYVLKRLAEALPEIVDKFLEQAKGGSVPHTKELMRMSGLDKEDAAKKPVEREPKSFAKLLMEEWEREQAAGELDEA